MGRINFSVPRLFPPGKVVAGFTDRIGGFSKGPWAELNLGRETGDDSGTVERNRRLLSDYAGVGLSDIAVMNQVHGTTVSVVDRGGQYDGDGILTGTPGILLGVLVADCVPLLLYDPEHHAAGAVHGGWRSITGGITGCAVDLMRETWGTRPERLLAALGPSAGACCYEIGEDVADRLLPGSVVRRAGKLFGDLRADLSARLVEAGLLRKNLDIHPDCTICGDRYFSHRRDRGITGRMMGFVVLKK